MCTICLLSDHYELNPRTQQECNVAILACGHKFHLTCLLNCLASGDRRCPLCRCTYFTCSTQEQWLRQERLKSLADLIQYGFYAYFFYRLLVTYGSEELTLAQLFSHYAPPSSGNNVTILQHVVGLRWWDLVFMVMTLAFDMACMQVQGAMYKIYMAGIVVMWVIHFFVPIVTS